MGIKAKIVAFLVGMFSKEMVVFLLSASPIFELRLSVPLGILYFELPIYKVYLLAVAGNILPILPLLYFLRFFFKKLQDMRGVGSRVPVLIRSSHHLSLLPFLCEEIMVMGLSYFFNFVVFFTFRSHQKYVGN